MSGTAVGLGRSGVAMRAPGPPLRPDRLSGFLAKPRRLKHTDGPMNRSLCGRIVLALVLLLGTPCTPFAELSNETPLDVLIERNVLQMSQVLGPDRIASRPQARDIAEAVVHRTRQARHGSRFATLDETVSALGVTWFR